MNVLERLARLGRAQKWLPVAVFGPLAVLQIAVAAVVAGPPGFAAPVIFGGAGLFLWTLLEYGLHRFSFHAKTERALSSGLHRRHHREPGHPDYVIAPVALSLPIYLGVLAGLAWASRDLTFTAYAGIGVISGYLFYEWVHYSSHQRQPGTRPLRFLKKYHMIHHFQDPTNYFGVTSPLWDWVFGTPRALPAPALSSRKK